MDPTSLKPPNEVDAVPQSLSVAVIRGITWNTAAVLAQALMGIMATIVVARHLSPGDFAVAGIAITTIAMVTVLVTGTFGTVLVQRRELSTRLVHSMFWTVLLIGGALAATVVLVAGRVAEGYREPFVRGPLIALASTVLTIALGQVPLALLQRRMQFREIVLIRTGATTVAALVAVVLAVRGFGFWSLVIQQVIAEGITAAAALFVASYVPRLRVAWSDVREAAPFAATISAYNVLYTLGARADYLVMAHYWTPSAAGQYFFAYERSRQVLTLMLAQVGGTLLPALSRIQHDRARLRAAFLRSTRLWCLVIYPLHVLLIGLADPLVPLLFGRQWTAAVPVVQLFVTFTLVGAPWSMASDALTAAGWPQGNLYFAAIRAATTLAALLALGRLGATIVQTAGAMMLIWLLIAPIWGVFLSRIIGLRIDELWCSLRDIFAASAGMGAILVAVRVLVPADVPAIAEVLLAGVAASLMYVAVLRQPLRALLEHGLHAVGRSGGGA